MVKSIWISLIAMLCLHNGANAALPLEVQMTKLAQEVSAPADLNALLEWKVGDWTDYSLKGGVISGKMHVLVRNEVTEGFWVQQDMDLGFMGKQKIEILYDKNTGKVLQLLVNDEKKTPPDPSDMEVVETRNEKVTVPKGTFDCIYAKILNKKENQTTEAWLSPNLVPVSGMVKTLTPSQMGVITVVLTNFLKQ